MKRALALVLLMGLAGGARTDGVTRPVRLVAGGDVILGRGVAASARGQQRSPLAGVAATFRAADLGFVNLESPLTRLPRTTRGLDLRADPQMASLLRPAGITLVSTVNNHTLDGGPAGRNASRATLRNYGVTPLSEDITFLRVAHQRLAWVALQEGQPWPWDALRHAAAHSDALIVSVHWGMEYRGVTARQRELARQLVAAGARVVLGHGPHVLQPVERLGDGLVAYSLGNLAFDSDMPSTRESALSQVSLSGGAAQACAVPLRLRRTFPEVVPPRLGQRMLDTLGVPPCAP